MNLSDKIKEILKGIDEDECSSNDGWFGTSTGVEFGKEKINQVLEAVESHLKESFTKEDLRHLYEDVDTGYESFESWYEHYTSPI